MERISGTNTLIPLPEFSPRYVAGLSRRRDLGFRRFGIFEDDLRLNFENPNRAELATRLLHLCTIDRENILPDDFFRELSVGKRVECLSILALGTCGEDAFRFPFKCAMCSAELELELTLAEVSAFQSGADAVDTVGIELRGERIEFRMISALDQEILSKATFDDELDAAKALISRLTSEIDAVQDLGPNDIEAIEQAMDEADPLVNFSCRITCDECGEPNDHEIDLFETALDILGRAQRRLIMSIHRLASRYHWSEKEIFEVPEWRRQQYVELIGAKL